MLWTRDPGATTALCPPQWRFSTSYKLHQRWYSLSAAHMSPTVSVCIDGRMRVTAREASRAEPPRCPLCSFRASGT